MTPAPAAAPVEKHLTRTGIMISLTPTVSACLTSIPGLVQSATNGLTFTSTDALRRTFRALMTIGIKLMLDANIHPEVIFGEAKSAIFAEMKERAAKLKQQGATQAAPTLPS